MISTINQWTKIDAWDEIRFFHAKEKSSTEIYSELFIAYDAHVVSKKKPSSHMVTESGVWTSGTASKIIGNSGEDIARWGFPKR